MTGLSVLGVAIGLGVIFLAFMKILAQRSVDEAEERMNLLIEQAADYNPEFESVKAEKKKKRKSGPKKPGMVDRLATVLERSRYTRDKEGQEFISRLEMDLRQAGIYEVWPPYRALALALLIWFVGLTTGLFLFFVIKMPALVVVFLIGVSSVYPILKLRQLKQKRQERIRAEIPTIIASLAMALSGSMTNISDAIRQLASRARSQGIDSPLIAELSVAEQQYAAGACTMAEALEGVSQRCGVVAVDNLIDALVQALQEGAELGPILVQYSEQAAAIWEQDMETMMARKGPIRTIGLVITLFGAVLAIAVPVLINMLRTLVGI